MKYSKTLINDPISEIIFYLGQLNLIPATSPNRPPTFNLTTSVSSTDSILLCSNSKRREIAACEMQIVRENFVGSLICMVMPGIYLETVNFFQHAVEVLSDFTTTINK